ncbi:IS110 family RNA-guided transposase [Ornithinibacillus halophilus]|uniref:Transposase IS116/IS110/IS902 family protein n=1 Tax=Ornithinibacillus halophilus TaxID=930117 RepID=A0A1M5HKJ9_9BACI|nr:IS110 family transposase [Ornithinibacillus halophilus]SHG16486.1 Transposase IS116/IS110/IS902 family protein [Ornithinibacillus halophilus]
MVQSLLNHIQGKNGSRWANFLRNIGSENILVVAIDAAKYTHKAMICNFYGDILVKPFELDASDTGFKKLKQKIHQEKEKFPYKEVVFGIEATGLYYEDLVRRSYKEKYFVRILNPVITSIERTSLLNRSKTDNLDLMAIVNCLIRGRGTSSPLASGSVRSLQKLTRARRALVQEKTSVQNHIRTYVDYIFREFQGKSIWVHGKKERVKPFTDMFGKTSLYIMRHCLHPSDILRLGKDGLRKLSIRENLKLRDSAVECLLDFAENSISQAKECVQSEQILLNMKLDQFSLLEKQIKELERKIEDLFIKTEGAIILSVPGIGLVTGAELFAEMGDISDFEHSGQLIKMAGTNPIIKQSGDRRPSHYRVSKEGRKSFRNIVYQTGKSLATNNPEMKQKYKALLDRGKATRQAYIAIGNRMLRLAFSMIKYQTLYRTDEENYVLLDQLNKKLHSASVQYFFEKFVSSTDYQSA